MSAAEPAERSEPAVRSRWLLLLPVGVALAVYAPSLGADFFGDDFLIILDNPQIVEGVSFRELFLSDWFDRSGVGGIGYYRPVTKASFRLDYLIAGRTPGYFHAVNVALHALNALLLALLGTLLFGRRAGVVAGVLFALHPSTAQAVNLITARSDVLATTGLLGMLLCFVRWRREDHPRWLGLGLLAFAMALGSKESVVLSVAALVVLARVEGADLRRTATAVGPFAGLLGAFLLLRSFCVTPVGDNHLAELGPARLALSVLDVLGHYLGPLLLAHPVLRLPPVPEGLLDVGVLLGGVLLAGATALAVRDRLASRRLFVLALGLSTLAPALVIWKIRIPQWHESLPMAERWTYTPMVALALGAGALLAMLRPRLTVVVTAACALVLVPLTLGKAEGLGSNLGYSRSVVEALGDVPFDDLNPYERYDLLVSLAVVASEEDRLEEGVAALERAIEVAPFHGAAWALLAHIQSRRGQHAAAEAAASTVLSDAFWNDPRGIEEHRRIGGNSRNRLNRPSLKAVVARARALRGELASAEQLIGEAVAEAERDGSATAFQYRYDQGRILELLGRPDEARAAYRRSIELDPTWPDARKRLADLEAAGK